MKPIAVVVLAVAVSLCAACPQISPQPQPPPPCGVTTPSTVEQADRVIERIPAYLGFVLDDALGGQTCVPGVAEDCAEQLDACIGTLSAVTGTTTTVVVDIESRGAVAVSVESIAIEGDCGCSVVYSDPFFIDAGTTVPVEVTFVAGEVGACDADFIVSAYADNVPSSQVRIPLRATVVAAP